MYGHFLILGQNAGLLTEQTLARWWPFPADFKLYRPLDTIAIGTLAAGGKSAARMVAGSDDGRVVVSVDGYLFCDSLPPSTAQEKHFARLANLIRKRGMNSALESITAGCYNIVAVDLDAQSCFVANDHLASIPLYFSPLPNGCLISSNPVASAASKLIDNTIDWTACAEWTLLGHTIGPRFFMRGITMFEIHTCLEYDAKSGTTKWLDRPKSPIFKSSTGVLASTAEIESEFERCLHDLSQMDPDPAQFQSAGKDSRWILAAWPKERNPVCYTYGDPESLEVPLARAVSELRGSRWVHVWSRGDDVAPHIDGMFNTNGLIVFPDRYMAAMRIAREGHAGALDGLLGDIYLGGGYCSYVAGYAGLVPKVMQHATVYIEQYISKVGLGRFISALYRDLKAKDHTHPLTDYVRTEFVDFLESHEPAVLADIKSELEKHMPENDSLAELRRNFMLANRSAHAIIQQGVMCRPFVHMYYPFAADLRFLGLQNKVSPRQAAFHRPIIRVFRKYFPDYGRIVYGATLLPFTASPFRQLMSAHLAPRGLFIPGFTARPPKRSRDANSWGAWLAESARLRETAADYMRLGGILDNSRAQNTFNAIAERKKTGTGKMFHMAAIAKWISMSHQS
jgi:hypothetical protein